MGKKKTPKMSKIKLKEMYWQKVGKRNWVFGVKKNDCRIIQLQIHSKISIQRHAKVKGTASVFDGNFLYWAKRTGRSLWIPMIKEQKGRCGICKDHFLPDDKIQRDHIVPKCLGGVVGKPSLQSSCCSSLLSSKEN
jgi:RNA-directed DNA polymerase